MTRRIIIESKIRIVVKVFRLGGGPYRILDYFVNLGSVSKQTYIEVENDQFNYTAKNRSQLVRENKELIKKMEKLGFY